VVSAHENHAEVGVSEAGVNVEEEICGAAGEAKRHPVFTLLD